MAAAPSPPDDPGSIFAWIEPHWAAITSIAAMIVGAVWKAASLTNEIRAARADITQMRADQLRLEARVDRLIEILAGRGNFSPRE